MALGDSRAATDPKPKVVTGGLKGFTLNEDVDLYRMIVNVQGLPKTGKNHVAFTAPGDIAVQSFDIGLEGVVQKFNKTKKIYAAEYELDAQPGDASEADVEASAKKLWNKFVADYYDALATPNVRSVVWDQGTEVWELLRLSEWGKLSAKSQHYAQINPIFRRLVRAAYDGGKNLILIHKLKDEWKEGAGGKQSKTGNYELAGMKEIPYLVQVNLQCWRQPDASVPDCFHATVLDCRQNPEINNMDFQGAMMHFGQIGQMVFPDSMPEHWGM